MSKENLDISLSDLHMFSSVQLLGHVRLFETLWSAGCEASLSITNSRSLLKLTSIRLMMPSNNLICCHPLCLLPSILPSLRVCSNESVLHIRWPEYWSCSISFPNEYSGLISFRIDWFDLLTVQYWLHCRHCLNALQNINESSFYHDSEGLALLLFPFHRQGTKK